MAQTINYSNTTPAPPANTVNALWQNDSSNPPNVSIYIPSGQGGVANIPYLLTATGLTANYNAGTAVTIYTPTVATVLQITVTQAITVAGATSSTLPSFILSTLGRRGS